MGKYKNIIIGVFLLVGGAAAGWFLKPTATMDQAMMHEGHQHMETDNSSGGEEIWTCSMDPQVRQNEPGACPICGMDLIKLDNSMPNDDPTILRMSKESVKLAQIETFIVGGTQKMEEGNKGAPMNNTIKVDGTIKLDERTIKSQTAHMSGRLDALAVTFEGQYVTKGQEIATLFSTDLLAASQELITAAQYNDRVEGLTDAATQKLKNWKVTDAQISRILSTGKPIETITIYADQSGYVLDRMRSQGDYVKQGQALYTVGSTSRLWLIFDVFESDLANVKRGNKVTFTTPSVPNQEFKASVSYIDPMLNSTSRTAMIRAEIRNTQNKLKPGMLLSGQIYLSPVISSSGEKNQSVVVPNSAVLWTGERSVVYVQQADAEVPSYQYVEVEIGNRSGAYTTILSGLQNGDAVVSEGAFAVDAAAQLNNNMSMMNKNVKIKEVASSGVAPSYIDETPDAFRVQLDQAVVKYIDLKNAFVDTDMEGSSRAAEVFNSSIMDIDSTLIAGEAQTYWIEQVKGINYHVSNTLDAKNIEDQRAQFEFLSKVIINIIQAYGTDDKTYYVQHCPMASNNQGADWISTEDQIRNPYFGDKMMKCGSVKLELK